jgi:flavin-binding protein dodecin
MSVRMGDTLGQMYRITGGHQAFRMALLASTFRGALHMAESVYRVTELVGTSTESWEQAAKLAIETASSSLRDLRVAEVVKLDLTVEDGKVARFRARLNVSFKYEHE